MDFTKLGSRKKETKPTLPKKRYKEVEEIADEKTEENVEKAPPKKKVIPKPAPKKVGRRSWKQADVNYTRIAFDTPIDTKQKLKQLLANKFFGKYISQDEMINVAIDEFVKKHS